MIIIVLMTLDWIWLDCACAVFDPVPAVRSVTLNLTNKFSQCTFSVAEHHDLFTGLIILRQAWWRRTYDVIPHRPHRTDRETAAGKAQRYTIPTWHCFLSCHTRRVDNSESTATLNPPGTTDTVFTKLPRPLAKDRKIATLANWRLKIVLEKLLCPSRSLRRQE